MKGKDQRKKLSKLPSAFSINQIIPRDIIILSTDQYRLVKDKFSTKIRLLFVYHHLNN